MSAAIVAEDSGSGSVKVSYGKDSSAVDFRRGIQELAFQWGSGGCQSLLEHQTGGGSCLFWVFKVCVMATTVVARMTTSSATSRCKPETVMLKVGPRLVLWPFWLVRFGMVN